MEIKIVRWKGRIDASYEVVAEIEAKMITISTDNEEDCLCVEIEDLLRALNLR